MGVEHRFTEAAGLKQGKAQQHGIANTAPYRCNHISFRCNILHQHRVDADTDNDEERLEAQGEQGTQVVLAHLPPFPVGHGRHGDRRNGCDQVDFHHAAIGDDENTDGKRPHGNAHKQTLEPQTEQRPQIHLHEPGIQVCGDAGNVDAGVPGHHAGRAVYHALGHIENAHDDAPGVRDDQDGAGGLEYPLEKHPGVHIMQVIFIGDELDQLQRHHKGQDQTGNRQDGRFGQAADHVEHAAVPALGRLAHLGGDLPDLLVYAVEHPGEVAGNAAHQDFLQPLCELFLDIIHFVFLLSRPSREKGGKGGGFCGGQGMSGLSPERSSGGHPKPEAPRAAMTEPRMTSESP